MTYWVGFFALSQNSAKTPYTREHCVQQMYSNQWRSLGWRFGVTALRKFRGVFYVPLPLLLAFSLLQCYLHTTSIHYNIKTKIRRVLVCYLCAAGLCLLFIQSTAQERNKSHSPSAKQLMSTLLARFFFFTQIIGTDDLAVVCGRQ